MTRRLEIEGSGFRLDGRPFDVWGIRLANALENDAVTAAAIRALDEYIAHGVNTFSVFLQGGSTGGANPFNADGSFTCRTRRAECSDLFKGRGDVPGVAEANQVLDRLAGLIEEADGRKMVVNVGVFYQARIRQLADETAVLQAARETARWLVGKGYRNIFMDLVNEYGHSGFQSMPLCFGRANRCAPDGGEDLIAAFREVAPAIPVSISADSRRPVIFDGSDLALIHFPWPPQEVRDHAGRDVPVVLNEWGHGEAGPDRNEMAGRYSPDDVAKWQRTIRTMRDGGGFVFYHSMWKQHLTERGGPHFELGPAGAQPADGRTGEPSDHWLFDLVHDMTTGPSLGDIPPGPLPSP